MAEAVHKPGQAGEKMEDNREWMSLEILRIILERRLSAAESTNSNEPVFRIAASTPPRNESQPYASLVPSELTSTSRPPHLQLSAHEGFRVRPSGCSLSEFRGIDRHHRPGQSLPSRTHLQGPA